jgi:predicted membrane GTPase involved in stress response
VDDEYSGTVIDKMALRKAEMTDMRPSGGGKTRITFSAPSRGLIGYHGEFLSDTRGTGIMNRLFEKYGPYKGAIEGRPNGVLISNGGRGGGLCAERAGRSRRAVRFARRADLRRHDHRRKRQAGRP